MDMGFNHTASSAMRNGEVAQGFDWHGLRARFLAAQAYRAQVVAAPGAGRAPGSFDAGVAEALAGYADGTRGINPNGLADRKGNPPDGDATPGHADPTFEGNDD